MRRCRPSAAAAVAARGPVEEIVRAIYRTCLGLDDIPRAARFTDLGGDSLSAMRIASRVQQRLGVPLGVRDIFEARSVAALAQRVERSRTQQAGLFSEPAPIRAAAPGEALEMSFAQERLWFLHQFDPRDTSYNVPAAFRLRGTLHTGAAHQAFAEICRRHHALRTHFVDRGATAEPVLSASFTLPWVDVDLRRVDPAQARDGRGGHLPKRGRAVIRPHARLADTRELPRASTIRNGFSPSSCITS